MRTVRGEGVFVVGENVSAQSEGYLVRLSGRIPREIVELAEVNADGVSTLTKVHERSTSQLRFLRGHTCRLVDKDHDHVGSRDLHIFRLWFFASPQHTCDVTHVS